jgi:hypothetical protein
VKTKVPAEPAAGGTILLGTNNGDSWYWHDDASGRVDALEWFKGSTTRKLYRVKFGEVRELEVAPPTEPFLREIAP